MNIDRVIRDDFSLVYDENEKKIEKEEEEEFE
jgi:hypothetical protein